ncbi:gluconate 2-dehydrogenase subunit 3 family protein [Paenibacillus naphthalenovorans]|uniref:Subunit 3 of gluconate 2-dehydrogenase n=1 Tax=Paenibacillus naphthalenovorans TaxID=162209 RepID=A0A0U2M3I9_9BACL|nr:gluconate 2-dehydrogenase subunit 3 family protein [Paenibacillus naphthalenovorans]ALS21936.1 subunit 3 of gluconate 2-dehydrogenase [Paenibacillus naphthalenovorans]
MSSLSFPEEELGNTNVGPTKEPQEQFAPLKPRLGGFVKLIEFTEVQVAVLNAAADRIIPGGEGFPWPSEVGIVRFIARYITPSGEEPKWFPFAGEDNFKAELDKLGGDFLQADAAMQVEILKRIEQESPTFFSQFRDLVYYGYYSRPEVTKAINENLEAGRDYRSSPQPYGYLDVIEPWDESLFSQVKGSYIRTEDVKCVNVRTPDQPGAAGGKPPSSEEHSKPSCNEEK